MVESFRISESLIRHYISNNLDDFERTIKEAIDKVQNNDAVKKEL